MDRIKDSGSLGSGSIPDGATNHLYFRRFSYIYPRKYLRFIKIYFKKSCLAILKATSILSQRMHLMKELKVFMTCDFHNVKRCKSG